MNARLFLWVKILVVVVVLNITIIMTFFVCKNHFSSNPNVDKFGVTQHAIF